jgi:hypothetical protein
MSELKLLIPISKIDSAKRLVYGIATSETLDKSGEIFDYDSSKPFYEAWSKEISNATNGKSLGNVREMHSSIAAGKLTQRFRQHSRHGRYSIAPGVGYQVAAREVG